jgi:hypothetical protein
LGIVALTFVPLATGFNLEAAAELFNSFFYADDTNAVGDRLACQESTPISLEACRLLTGPVTLTEVTVFGLNMLERSRFGKPQLPLHWTFFKLRSNVQALV